MRNKLSEPRMKQIMGLRGLETNLTKVKSNLRKVNEKNLKED